METITLSVNEQLQNLEQLVNEKDQLLGMLTERLEQAAEQLDRFRREGSQPHYEQQRPPANGVIENEPDLREDLRQMLDDWQDLRERGWFDRLDQRLEAIQERTSNINQLAAPKSQPTSNSVEPSTKSNTSQKDGAESYTSSVAEILARYSKNEAQEPRSGTTSPPESLPLDTDSITTQSTGTSDPDSAFRQMLVPLPTAPDEIDIEAADLQQLRDAILVRDEYIALLQEYLRTMESTAQEPVRFPTLESLTSDQQIVLNDWSESVRMEFRQTQIQISLERAQLSRETMKLQNQKQIIERELKRLELSKRAGLTNSDEGDIDTGEVSRSRSWLGLFGTK